jgi:hypothetical protein
MGLSQPRGSYTYTKPRGVFVWRVRRWAQSFYVRHLDPRGHGLKSWRELFARR